jgi:hypothetical protein
MATRLRSSGFLIALGMLLSLFVGSGPAAAGETCSEAAIGSCFPEYSAIAALVRTPDGYAAVGRRDDGFDLLRLSGNADVLDRVSVPLPPWLDETDSLTIEELVAGADDALVAIGWASIGPEQQQRQVGVIGRIDRGNQVVWSQPVSSSYETSTILYSAVHDPDAQRYIVVGRHTNGADNGKCAFWSQAFLLSVPEAVAGASFSPFFIGVPEPGPENRLALYDIAPAGTPGQFVAVGFATAKSAAGKGCQDNAMAVLVSGGANGDWSVGSRYLIGLKDAGEVAFSVVRTDDGRFLLAGQGSDSRSQARAALLAVFSFGEKPAMRAYPYPEDGSDRSGGDRYRVIVPLRTAGRYLAAGSGSASKESRNQGIWTIVSNSLDPTGPNEVLTGEAGSDIVDAALGSDGRVLAVGTHGDGDREVGWIGFIFEQRFTAKRRQPDSTLPMLSSSEEATGSVTLSEREIAAGTGLRSAGARRGAGIELRMALTAETDLTVSALPSQGDLDLALIDSAGRIAAFSSNLDDAGEYLSARLAAGEYRLKVIAVSDVGEYELRVARSAGAEDAVIGGLEALDNSGRSTLSGLLEGRGYGAAGNPDIGLGGDTMRSLLAFYNTFQAGIDASAVQQFIANAGQGNGAAQ